MATQEASGTVTITTVGTEQTITTITTAKPFQAFVNISNLQAGEYVQINIKRKVLSTDISGYVDKRIYSWLDAAMTPVAVFGGLLSTVEYDLTINQLTGTARTFSWSVETP